MDILSPDYQPADGVTFTPAPVDAELRAADAADAVAAIRTALADVQAELHDLSMQLLADDFEARVDATYRLGDAASRLATLRFELELAL